jgi:hypothetical protein
MGCFEYFMMENRVLLEERGRSPDSPFLRSFLFRRCSKRI